MKIKTFLIIILMFTAVIGKSQAFWILVLGDKITNDRMQSGINVYITNSHLNGLGGTGSWNSWALGGYLDYKIKNRWNISLDLTVKSPTGGGNLLAKYKHFTTPDTLNSENLFLENTNFSVPIYVKYKTKYFNVALGPEMIYAYKSQLVYKAETINGESIKVTKSAKEYINRFDIGISGNIEFYLFPKRPTTSIRIGLRYYYGFLEPLKQYTNVRNSVFMLKVGIPVVGDKGTSTQKQ